MSRPPPLDTAEPGASYTLLAIHHSCSVTTASVADGSGSGSGSGRERGWVSRELLLEWRL